MLAFARAEPDCARASEALTARTTRHAHVTLPLAAAAAATRRRLPPYDPSPDSFIDLASMPRRGRFDTLRAHTRAHHLTAAASDPWKHADHPAGRNRQTDACLHPYVGRDAQARVNRHGAV